MKPNLLYLLLLSIFACGKDTSVAEKAILHTEKEIIKDGFSVIDSLNKYTNKDSLLIVDNADDKYSTLFIGKVEKHSYAVWMESDSLLVFYQKPDAKHWSISNTFYYGMPVNYVEGEDLNGDRFKDVKLCSFNGAAGNTENRIFLYDPSSGIFKLNEFYSLPNIKYNEKGKFIQSSWFSGAVHCQEKYKYIITGDSLIFDMGATFCPNEADGGTTGTLEYYKKINGRRITIENRKGKSGRLCSKFENAFWNSEHDIVN